MVVHYFRNVVSPTCSPVDCDMGTCIDLALFIGILIAIVFVALFVVISVIVIAFIKCKSKFCMYMYNYL